MNTKFKKICSRRPFYPGHPPTIIKLAPRSNQVICSSSWKHFFFFLQTSSSFLYSPSFVCMTTIRVGKFTKTNVHHTRIELFRRYWFLVFNLPHPPQVDCKLLVVMKFIFFLLETPASKTMFVKWI